MKNLTVLLTIGLLFFLSLAAFSQVSQSDAEYEKDTQTLLKKYGGYSRDPAKKTPREYLTSDKRLLEIFEKAKAFDDRYFKEDYQDLYRKYEGLIATEEVLVANYYYWLDKYHRAFSDFKMSPWEKFCARFLRRGKYKAKKVIAAARELEEFYQTMVPVLDSALVSFGQFWFKEKCRCTERGIIWEKIFYY